MSNKQNKQVAPVQRRGETEVFRHMDELAVGVTELTEEELNSLPTPENIEDFVLTDGVDLMTIETRVSNEAPIEEVIIEEPEVVAVAGVGGVAEAVNANYPSNLPGEFFNQYDKLSAVGKAMVNVIYEHMIVAGPDRALSDADGSRRQASLYHAIVGILNLPRPEFDSALALVLGTFLRFPKGAFSETARLRWMQFIQLTKPERDLFSVLMTMLPELAEGRTRKQTFKQFEKRFEKSLVEASGSTRLTKDAVKNTLAFFRK